MKVLWAIAIATATVSVLAAQTQEAKGPDPKKGREAQEQVRKLEQDFVDAFAKGTKAAVAHFERVLAQEAIITEHEGAVLSKAALLDMAKKGDRGPVKIMQKDLKIQVYGETAIATGLKIFGRLGENMRFTHVYVLRNGHWQLAAAHWSVVRRP
jgi:ketosteroid isomerase-like protein